MSGKKSRPELGILPGSLVSGYRSGLVEAATIPRTQVEPKSRSPKGLVGFDFGGVGLGIVAALEKAGDAPTETPVLFSLSLTRSNPIPVTSPKNSRGSNEEMESESSEEYTVVTCRLPNNSYTKVFREARRGEDSSNSFRIQSGKKSSRASVFHIAPARFGEAAGTPASDFLSSCHLCQKKLQGEDIYMYRGEKGFCSTECRYRQIVMDERRDKCRSEASRPVDVSSSPYANGQIFTTGILAT